jgi:hypothetical protein
MYNSETMSIAIVFAFAVIVVIGLAVVPTPPEIMQVRKQNCRVII